MIGGSIVALVTPMFDDDSIDWESMDTLLEMHIREGTGAIVSVGTTGESATLSVKEHCAVIAHTVKKVDGAIPVIAGTGANSTIEAIELTAAAKADGADACLLVTPYYNKPTQEGLYQHHKCIAEAVSIPQILYNVPGRTGVDMLPATVGRLAEIENIIGIKEATGDLQRGREVLDVCAGKMAVYSGDDETAAELILMGAKGNISVTANVAPALMAELCRLALAGDKEQTRALNARLLPLSKALFQESNPIPVKWALARRGMIGDHLRLPLTELAQAC
ncbi:MAG: 4-hydroxy-tetrahydrodipicolinate synthase, partial [Lysobacterales bacterium]